MRVLVNLDGASLADALGLSDCRSAAARRLRIENRDDVAQAVAIIAQKIAELLLELDLTLQAIIVCKRPIKSPAGSNHRGDVSSSKVGRRYRPNLRISMQG